MDKDIKYFMSLNYRTDVKPDRTTDDNLCYVASHPELSGCMSHGDTTEEAIDNLKEAKLLYITTLFEEGKAIPLPKMPQNSFSLVWKIISTDDIETTEVNLPFSIAQDEYIKISS